MLNDDATAKKIQFYLRVYFVVFVGHPYLNTAHSPDHLKRAQADFKHYLDTKGVELSKTSEFLAFYALPYIPSPIDHPSFKALYTREWVM